MEDNIKWYLLNLKAVNKSLKSSLQAKNYEFQISYRPNKTEDSILGIKKTPVLFVGAFCTWSGTITGDNHRNYIIRVIKCHIC